MIEGKLVNLRAQEMSDLERMTRWVNDREVTRSLSVRYPWSLGTEEAWLRNRMSTPIAYGDASFAIETKDGVHIGSTGLHRASPENRAAELGIMVGEKAYWSKGYGTDAVATVVLHVFDFNERAQAAYRKCGFVEEGRMRDAHYAEGAYCDVLVMSLLCGEWIVGSG